MSLVATSERQSTLSSATSALKKFSFTSPTKSEIFDDQTWPRTSASDWKRRIAEKTKSLEVTLWHQLPSPSSPTSDLACHQAPTPRQLLEKIRNCLLSSPLVDRVVLKNGSMLEERMDNVSNHQEILHTADYERHHHKQMSNLIYSKPKQSRATSSTVDHDVTNSHRAFSITI